MFDAQAFAQPNRLMLVVAREAKRDALAAHLMSCGYRVLAAGTPRDALVLGHTEACDAVVVDIHAEDVGLAGGVGVVDALREGFGRRAPAIALVADGDRDRAEAAVDGGFNVALHEPIELTQLAAAIAGMASTSPGAGAGGLFSGTDTGGVGLVG